MLESLKAFMSFENEVPIFHPRPGRSLPSLSEDMLLTKISIRRIYKERLIMQNIAQLLPMLTGAIHGVGTSPAARLGSKA